MRSKAEIFVSYARRDSNVVIEIIEGLREDGFEFWLDREGIDGSVFWRAEIVEAIALAPVVIFFASPQSSDSENVAKELALASEERKPILPVFIEPTKLSTQIRYQIAGVQHIAWYENPIEARKQIALALQRGSDSRISSTKSDLRKRTDGSLLYSPPAPPKHDVPQRTGKAIAGIAILCVALLGIVASNVVPQGFENKHIKKNVSVVEPPQISVIATNKEKTQVEQEEVYCASVAWVNLKKNVANQSDVRIYLRAWTSSGLVLVDSAATELAWSVGKKSKPSTTRVRGEDAEPVSMRHPELEHGEILFLAGESVTVQLGAEDRNGKVVFGMPRKLDSQYLDAIYATSCETSAVSLEMGFAMDRATPEIVSPFDGESKPEALMVVSGDKLPSVEGWSRKLKETNEFSALLKASESNAESEVWILAYADSLAAAEQSGEVAKSPLYLSRKWAMDLRQLLVDAGITTKRLRAIGYGDTKPKIAGSSTSNNRIEVFVKAR